MTDSVVVEGYVKFRDGKKWKTRWVVLRKPSPVADCLVLLVYKDKSDKAQGHREKGSITLEDICGLETGLSYEGVNYTLAILCLSQVAVLGFDGKEALLAWDIRIRYSLGEVHRFSVGILPGTKLESGSAILHLCNNLLVLARDIPPVIIGQWNLPDLRRYGPVPNGFVFEGGTRCGYWAGVFFLSSMEGEQISFLFDCIVRGISPTRGPFGLRPILPDPNAAANQAYSEERVNHEAQELEKRLSMLSHQSSTAFAYGLSEAGDDRSISGSSDTSDTSQSDSSIGSRLAIWTEPVTTSSAPTDTIIGHSGSKVALQAEDKLSVIQVCGAHAVAKPPRSRQLQEIGRQSSSDSGIATGSHSSYSGSFSSYAGSLDIGSGGDDFGSLLSLPTHLDLAPCTCPPAPGKEYQVPTSLRYLYDTPRNLLQGGTGGARGHQTSTTSKDQAGSSPQSPPSCKSVQREKEGPLGGRSDTVARRSTADLLQGHSEESKSRVAPSSDSQHPDSYQICSSSQATASKTLLIICATCGGFKGTPVSYTAGSAMPAVPAGESIDKCPCRPNNSSSEYIKVDALRKTTETTSSPASVTNHRSEKLKMRDEGSAALQKKGKGKLADLLADLLGYGGTSGEPGTKTNELNLYESMASALGRELRSQQPVINCDLNSARPGDKETIIYENCFKCKKGEECHLPPWGTAAFPRNSFVLQVGQMHHSGVCFGQPLPSEPLKNSVDCEKTSNEEQPIEVQLLGPTLQDGDLPCLEVKDHSVSVEDKKQKSKEERHKVEYEIMESRALEKSSEVEHQEPEEKSKYELMGSCGQQRLLHETEAAMFVFPPEMAAPERPRGDGVTYVNIPISPTSKKQLNYMELEHQEQTGVRGTGQHLPGQNCLFFLSTGKSSTKYAQIDITATDAAHKTGTQHALGREEGLHTLEQRRRGVPQ
ncbi:protein Dok-7-like isoform X1 [Salvelinus fontinalis]|uniref:protein Dok-7-like isoform X1 n=1 Tax=Salvelinus fontinalis TaxID=8038 RepID=UPI0024854248|nr:protein Dok-7-like isoform X1 [Salvelinus fontinalis]